MEEHKRKRDKRSTDRIFIPGATILVRRGNGFGLFERYSRPMELYNFTKSGICFLSDQDFMLGDKIMIQIIIPGEKSIRLVSQVRWIENGLDDQSRVVGVQFRAFGKGTDYNPLNSLDTLRNLQQKFR